MNYKKLNISLGWLAFLIATIVYFLTVEETASLWDCGEYITAAYKLEVGHPPGAPLFMLLGRLFSFFSSPENVGLWINRMSAISSSLTILFLFWTITLLGKKIALKEGTEMSKGQQIAVLASGFVGAMAYTFTESFWFSAVEGEVYAMSSLFTAVIFWATLKWDEENTMIRQGLISPEVRPLRWMVLIMFLFGLAIGVHLLGLLVLPCIAYVVMFNYRQGKEVSAKLFFLTGILGVFVLAFVQEGIIPGTIALASNMEIYFRNSLGLPFVSGAIFFFTLLVGILIAGLVITAGSGLIDLSASAPGTYTVTYTTPAPICFDTETFVITVNPEPAIDAVTFSGDNLGGCTPITVTFTNTSATALGSECVWSLSNGTVLLGCDNVAYTFTNPGCYDVTLEITSANGCSNSATIEDYVCVQPYPNAYFTHAPNQLTTINTTVNFSNGSIGASNYQWFFGDGATSNAIDPTHTYPETEGTYEVTLVASTPFGCTDTIRSIVNVAEELIFYLPNTFTPDGNDFNETFQPVFTSGYDPFDFHLMIFNRWGELIFESYDASIGWDGTYGGKASGAELVKDGTYVWKIEVKTKLNDERKMFVGHVNVLR